MKVYSFTRSSPPHYTCVKEPADAALYHPVPQSSVKNHQSQTYLTYIQGLRLGSDTMCDWTRELESTQTLLSTDQQGTLYLPTVVTAATASTGNGPAATTPWLEYIHAADNSSPLTNDTAAETADSSATMTATPSSINTTNGVNSLCALRDFMIQEALNVVKFA